MSANTAIHIVALPKRARTKKTALIPNARLMYCQRIALVRLERRMDSVTLRRSSFMITMSAASMAVSVPIAHRDPSI